MSDPHRLPLDLKQFVEGEAWTFAKTMPEWPHEYLVRDRVDAALFESLVRHIRQYGDAGKFYKRTMIYFAEDGLLYWTMGDPLPETVIINRCQGTDSYEYRLKNGTLPKQNASRSQNAEEGS
jgi:hypothetical protein